MYIQRWGTGISQSGCRVAHVSLAGELTEASSRGNVNSSQVPFVTDVSWAIESQKLTLRPVETSGIRFARRVFR